MSIRSSRVAARFVPFVPFVVVVVAGVCGVSAAGCSGSSPNGQVEKAVRAIYAGPLGARDEERDRMRLQGTDKLRGAMAAMDASCGEILASDAPNHGLTGPAAADFARACLDQRPLSCGTGPAELSTVEVRSITGDSAVAIARVVPAGGAATAATGVELELRVVDGAWKLDEARCP